MLLAQQFCIIIQHFCNSYCKSGQNVLELMQQVMWGNGGKKTSYL